MKGIFWKKPIDKILEPDPGHKHLKRSIGLFGLILMGIGSIIGAGLSLTIGTAIGFSGPSLFISFIIGGIAASLTALCLAELVSMMPVSGSVYSYTYVAFGEIWAWIMGLILLIQTLLAVGALAHGWSEYLLEFFSSNGINLHYLLIHLPFIGIETLNIPVILIITLISLLLIFGAKESSRANAGIIFIKIFVILMFIGIGLKFINPANYHPLMPYGWLGVFQGAAIIFFAFGGFESITAAAEEVKNPQRTLPLAILCSLSISFILYVVLAIVLSGMLPYASIKAAVAPMAVALKQVGVGWGSEVLVIGSIAGISSTILVNLFFQSRIFYAMGRDKLLPSPFSKLHPRFRTPAISIIILCVATSIVASIMSIDQLIIIVTFSSLLEFIIISAMVIILRRQLPDFQRPFKCPMVPLVPILAIISCGFIITQIPFNHIWIFIVLLVCGLPPYFLYRAWKNSGKH
jgi:APA family basic amino acid/polyamine antiporter